VGGWPWYRDRAVTDPNTASGSAWTPSFGCQWRSLAMSADSAPLL
jgi:hypothetical protein